jgi:hypothetical protein
MSETPEVSAIGYSVRAIVADGYELVMQHHIAHDADDAQVNRDMDRLFGLARRQKQLLEEPGLIDEKRDLLASVAQYEIDLASVEERWQEAALLRTTQMAKLKAGADDAYQQGYEEHAATGRASAYAPQGSTKSKIKAFASDIARLEEEQQRAEAERSQARQNLEIQIKARNNRIGLIDQKLVDIAALKSEP